jgi:hypothetical protein
MRKKIAEILNSFYYEGGVGHVMYFTEDEAEILAEHLVSNGVGVWSSQDRSRLVDFKEYFKELYGQGLEIANWHQNGELEPFDNFYESAIEYSLRKGDKKDDC